LKRYLRIIVIGFTIVGLAHFFLIEYLGWLTPIAFIAIVAIVFRQFKNEDSVWDLVLILFVCHHFWLGENRGGTLSYIVLLAGVVYILRAGILKRFPDGPVLKLVLFVIAINVIAGYIHTGFAYIDQVFYGLVILFSTFVTFKMVSGFELSEERLKDIAVVGSIMIVYMALVTINQRFSFIAPSSYVAFLPPSNRDLGPMGELLPAQSDDAGALLSALVRPLGTFYHFELTGEYGLLFFLFLLPFFFYRDRIMRARTIAVVAFCSLFIVFNTLNRGPILLLPFAYLGGLLLTRFLDHTKMKLQVFFVPLLFLMPLVLFPEFVELTGVYQRLTGGDAFVGGVPGTRIGIWDQVIPKLSEIPLTGLGMRPGYFMEQNFIGVAPHSLYLALPFYYGWIGGILFVSLIVVTTFRLFSAGVRKSVASHLRFASVGLFLFFVAFLIDQYKIDILRQVQYQHLIWFYIGFAASVLKTARRTRKEPLVPDTTSQTG